MTRSVPEFLRRPATPLVLFAVLTFTAAVFTTMSRLASSEAPHALDNQILLALRTPGNLNDPVGSLHVEEFFGDITALAGWPVLLLFTLLVTAFLLLKKHWVNAGILLAVVIGESLMVSELKGLFNRERPTIVPHLQEASNFSFPSGHSASAAAIYLTIAALLARETSSRRQRAFLITAAIFLVVLIGFSRVYLGVHYPSDVAAGWAFGAAWAIVVLGAARRLDGR